MVTMVAHKAMLHIIRIFSEKTIFLLNIYFHILRFSAKTLYRCRQKPCRGQQCDKTCMKCSTSYRCAALNENPSNWITMIWFLQPPSPPPLRKIPWARRPVYLLYIHSKMFIMMDGSLYLILEFWPLHSGDQGRKRSLEWSSDLFS